jgi:hypothetical protein
LQKDTLQLQQHYHSQNKEEETRQLTFTLGNPEVRGFYPIPILSSQCAKEEVFLKGVLFFRSIREEIVLLLMLRLESPSMMVMDKHVFLGFSNNVPAESRESGAKTCSYS